MRATLDSPGFRMTEASVDAVRAALDAYLDPYLQDKPGRAQAVREVRARARGSRRAIALAFRSVATRRSSPPRARALAAAGLRRRSPSTRVDIRASCGAAQSEAAGDIRNIVAVASGKGESANPRSA